MWITKSKRKNDRVDSIKIAKLHLVNMIPNAHLLSDEDRIVRDLLIQRLRLGQSIADTKNSITGYLERKGSTIHFLKAQTASLRRGEVQSGPYLSAIPRIL